MEHITEEEVKVFFQDILNELPPSESQLRIIGKTDPNAQIDDVQKILTVKVDRGGEGVPSYSEKEFGEFINAVFFNINMTGSTMVLLAIQLDNAEPMYMANIIITNFHGVAFYMPENSPAVEGRTIVFIDSISSLKALGK